MTKIRRLPAAAAIWLLAGLQIVLAVALYAGFVHGLGPLPGTPFEVPALVMVVLFFLVEVWVVHIPLRRDAHSFSLSEIPIVIGMYFVEPSTYVLTLVVGLVAALGLHRRQSIQKLVFNVGHFVLGGIAALLVFRAVVDPADPIDPQGWLAAMLGAGVASLVSVLSIFTAISVSEGRLQVKKLVEITQFAIIGTFTNVSLALVGVITAWHDSWAALLLVIPIATIYLSYRAYTSQKQQHETLEFLYESSRLLHESQEVEAALGSLLTQARSTFRAGVAELLLFSPRPDEAGLRVRTDGEAGIELTEHDPVTDDERQLLSRLHGAEARLVSSEDREHDEVVDTFLRGRDVRGDAMLAALAGETRPLGIFVLGDRLGDLTVFDSEDLRLFETLANHVSSSLEVGRLEKTLDQLTELKDELRHRAFHDGLTGLANRAHFAEAVDDTLAEERDEMAVLFLDLDDFKAVNDSLGHAAGDELLQAVAHRFAGCLRDGDLAARLGGDEFAALLRGIVQREQAHEVAERILAAMAPSFRLEADEITTHASVGIAFPDAEVADADDLLRNADVAMYAAKRDRKGSIRSYEAAMQDAARTRLTLRGELQLALEDHQFEMFFQPLVGLQSGEVVGAEALLRWNHPERGLVAPSAFLAYAEEMGLLIPIGRWVALAACTAAAAWPGELMLTMNIAPSQIHRTDVHRMMVDALAHTQLAPERLVIEVTETAVMDDVDTVRDQIGALSAAGIRLALDDFGTGYSSLEHLSRLPIHLLKVAKPFVDGIGRPGSRAVVARAVIELAHALGLRCIAEGIEATEQADQLRAWGCEMGQGFAFGRPVPQERFLELVRSGRTGLAPGGVPSR